MGVIRGEGSSKHYLTLPYLSNSLNICFIELSPLFCFCNQINALRGKHSRQDTQLVTLLVRLGIVLTCNYHAITITMAPFTYQQMFFFPLSLSRLSPDLTIYASNMACVLQKQELLTLEGASRAPEFTMVIQWGLCCSLFLIFCVVLLFVFTLLVPYCDFRHDFPMKTMFGSSLPPIACRRAYVLFTLFVFIGVQHILCCGFCFA